MKIPCDVLSEFLPTYGISSNSFSEIAVILKKAESFMANPSCSTTIHFIFSIIHFKLTVSF